jgi:hypothetical protein
MTVMSVWGMVSAFGNSPMFGYVMLAWMLAASVAFSLVASMNPPGDAKYDRSTRTYALPGSWIPMLLISGIFLTKYVVGVELAMQPSLARDTEYALIVAGLYGVFSGIFAGRAGRLWRLTRGTVFHSTLAA